MRAGRQRIATVLTAALIAGGVGPAAASTTDRGSTRTFIAAATAAQVATVAAHSRARRSVDAFVAGVRAGCGGAGIPGSGEESRPQAVTRTALFQEATVDLVLAESAPIRAPLTAYARRVTSLRWTNPAIGRAIAAILRQDELIVALRPSHLCADFATGAAGGFAAIPAATGAFLRAADPALRATRSNTSLLELMRPYVTPDEAAATRRVSRLQREAHRLYGGIGTAGLKALNTALYGS